MRADSGFYIHAIVAVCRKLNVRFSITIRQHQSLRNLTLAIPEARLDARPLVAVAPLLTPSVIARPVIFTGAKNLTDAREALRHAQGDN